MIERSRGESRIIKNTILRYQNLLSRFFILLLKLLKVLCEGRPLEMMKLEKRFL